MLFDLRSDKLSIILKSTFNLTNIVLVESKHKKEKRIKEFIDEGMSQLDGKTYKA